MFSIILENGKNKLIEPKTFEVTLAFVAAALAVRHFSLHYDSTIPGAILGLTFTALRGKKCRQSDTRVGC